ncbi:GMC oxidoreductase [Dongia deserti]|uniref:GMC oxidoreductase n=1 Tax=Dongia deserti TaxID=2268030 RepID=UPI000E65B5A3|nr:GMC family oxidoreductase [Dongia deserti]
MIIDELPDRQYPVVVVGTGFGALFFVHKLLQLQPATKVLMLERGPFRSWETQVAEGHNSHIRSDETFKATGIPKFWNFTIAYGGGTNCWGANTPRMHPNDFRQGTLYGRGQDWPLSYDDLEPYYSAAEQIMDISGPDDLHRITPRSLPYPQPPHRLSAVDRIMKTAQPDMHFALPSARSRVATKQRPQCCASFDCEHCPIGAKFTVHNGFAHIMDATNVLTLVEAEVIELERSSPSAISGVRFRWRGREHRVGCDVCVLGANAIHSPAILLRSGFDDPLLGRGLNEQLGVAVEVLLDGLDSMDGSTISTGANYAFYDGPFRAERGAIFMVFDNDFPYGLRKEFGRWRQTLSIRSAIADELNDENRVSVNEQGEAVVHYVGNSAYTERALEHYLEHLPQVLAPLPVERIVDKGLRRTQSHVQGTLRMGARPADSVVDDGQIHHHVRNLVVVGTSVMPTCPPVQPSLTAAALSLRAADLMFGAQS